MTDDDLNLWRKLSEAATKGKWSTCGTLPANGTEHVCSDSDSCYHNIIASSICEHENAAFIAAARTAVPALLDEVERLRRENAELKYKLSEEHGE